MKSAIKRSICLAFTITLLVAAFTGCGGKKASTDDKVTVIRVWTGFGHTKDMLTQKVSEYNNTIGKEKGIRIEYTAHGGNYRDVFDMAFANDQAPELLKVTGNKTRYVERGDIIPITDMPGGQEFLDEYGVPANEGYNLFDGKVYSAITNVTTIGLVYNKDLFKAAGIVDENGEALPPKTWDEVRQYAKRITDTSKMVYGISIPLKDASFYETWQLMSPFLSSYNSVVDVDWENFTYDYSKVRFVYEWLLGIKEDKSFFPGAESLDNDAARAQFAEGRIGMFIGASWDVGVLTSQFTATCDWGVAPIPLLKEGERYQQYQNTADFLCISKAALKTDAKKVMEVYKWFHSDEMWTAMYEQERDIPYKYELIKNSTVDTSPQWKQFAEFVSIGRKPNPGYALSVEGPSTSEIMLKIWAGVMSIEEAIKDLNERYTAAFRKGINEGSIDPSLHNISIDYRIYD